MKTYILHELKSMIERMELFTNKLRREDFLSKLGELERSKDLGEIETKKYLTNRLAIDIIYGLAICLLLGAIIATVTSFFVKEKK